MKGHRGPGKRHDAAEAKGPQTCPYCSQRVAFCWTCHCGFRMCQDCMLHNAWGITCNNITWVCPDCGEIRTY